MMNKLNRECVNCGNDFGSHFKMSDLETESRCPAYDGKSYAKGKTCFVERRNAMPIVNEIRITDPQTGGQKGVKPERFDLFPFDALEEVARVYGYGAKKYEDDNWLRGYRWRLSAGALLRHVARWMIGEDRDPETGCLHLAHAAWHCLTLITFDLRGLGTDDRGKNEPVVPASGEGMDVWPGDEDAKA